MASSNSKRNPKEMIEENELYSTPTIALETFHNQYPEVFGKYKCFYDPCDGLGQISDYLESIGKKVYRGDIVDYRSKLNFKESFLDREAIPEDVDCIICDWEFAEKYSKMLLICSDVLVMVKNSKLLSTKLVTTFGVQGFVSDVYCSSNKRVESFFLPSKNVREASLHHLVVPEKHKDRKLVYGVGVNDLPYKMKNNPVCPYFNRWKGMLERCYSEKMLAVRETYQGCEVCKEWQSAKNFKQWMEAQDWEGKHLDKDLLGDGKIYSPETCAFITQEANSLLVSLVRIRNGEYPSINKIKSGWEAYPRIRNDLLRKVLPTEKQAKEYILQCRYGHIELLRGEEDPFILEKLIELLDDAREVLNEE